MNKIMPRDKYKGNCPKCGNERRKGGKYCNGCHATHMRASRPKHSELSEKARKKANARAYLKEYVKRGKVTKKPCIVCGKLNAQAHHENYDQPLEVMWLCRQHHVEWHKEFPAKQAV